MTPLENQGAMTDGSKRLRETLDNNLFDIISSATEFLGKELFMIPISILPGITDKVLDQFIANLIPDNMNFRVWNRTRFAFAKFVNSGKTYREVYIDDEITGYCKWSMGYLGNKNIGPITGLVFFSLYIYIYLCRILERLESQRVVLLEFQYRDSWITENLFMQ